MYKFQLDYTLDSTIDRLNLIKTLELKNLTQSELETCSNYILYGKDSNGTSIVDRKEIFIKTKFNSYSKNAPTSLDALLETPTFDESIFQTHNIYKKVKPTIDKEKVKNIKGMEELWKEIEKLEKKLEDDSLNSKQKYYLKH